MHQNSKGRSHPVLALAQFLQMLLGQLTFQCLPVTLSLPDLPLPQRGPFDPLLLVDVLAYPLSLCLERLDLLVLLWRETAGLQFAAGHNLFPRREVICRRVEVLRLWIRRAGAVAGAEGILVIACAAAVASSSAVVASSRVVASPTVIAPCGIVASATVVCATIAAASWTIVCRCFGVLVA